ALPSSPSVMLWTLSLLGEAMAENLPSSARKLQQSLHDLGYFFEVFELPNSARTAQDAAQAIGCNVAQIAKSIVFRGKESGAAILAVVSGSNQADTAKLATLAGEPVGKANADFVRAHTGYVIGGVPPTGHEQPLRTFIDADLLVFDEIWAA